MNQRMLKFALELQCGDVSAKDSSKKTIYFSNGHNEIFKFLKAAKVTIPIKGE